MDVHADGFVRLLAGWIVRRARKGKRRLRSYDSAASPLTTLLAVGTCTLLPASLLSRDAMNRERERERERERLDETKETSEDTNEARKAPGRCSPIMDYYSRHAKVKLDDHRARLFV